jgi:hypothetical protein
MDTKRLIINPLVKRCGINLTFFVPYYTYYHDKGLFASIGFNPSRIIDILRKL